MSEVESSKFAASLADNKQKEGLKLVSNAIGLAIQALGSFPFRRKAIFLKTTDDAADSKLVATRSMPRRCGQ